MASSEAEWLPFIGKPASKISTCYFPHLTGKGETTDDTPTGSFVGNALGQFGHSRPVLAADGA